MKTKATSNPDQPDWKNLYYLVKLLREFIWPLLLSWMEYMIGTLA